MIYKFTGDETNLHRILIQRPKKVLQYVQYKYDKQL